MHIFDLFNLNIYIYIYIYIHIVLFFLEIVCACIVFYYAYIYENQHLLKGSKCKTGDISLHTCHLRCCLWQRCWNLHQENGCSSFQKMENAILKNCRFYSSKNENLYFEICQFMYKRFSNKMARSRSGRWSCSSLHWQTYLREKCVHSVPKVVLLEKKMGISWTVNHTNWRLFVLNIII